MESVSLKEDHKPVSQINTVIELLSGTDIHSKYGVYNPVKKTFTSKYITARDLIISDLQAEMVEIAEENNTTIELYTNFVKSKIKNTEKLSGQEALYGRLMLTIEGIETGDVKKVETGNSLFKLYVPLTNTEIVFLDRMYILYRVLVLHGGISEYDEIMDELKRMLS